MLCFLFFLSRAQSRSLFSAAAFMTSIPPSARCRRPPHRLRHPFLRALCRSYHPQQPRPHRNSSPTLTNCARSSMNWWRRRRLMSKWVQGLWSVLWACRKNAATVSDSQMFCQVCSCVIVAEILLCQCELCWNPQAVDFYPFFKIFANDSLNSLQINRHKTCLIPPRASDDRLILFISVSFRIWTA